MQYLPLFFDLRGRPVLVVGGGAVAARKLALLLEAGADVTVVAPAARRGAGRGALRRPLHLARGPLRCRPGRGPAPGDRRHGRSRVNAAVAAACEAAGLPVNVVDDPELSNTIVPAIIDRSPLMIAVSSAGTAPMLARAVRERLETLVDESFGALARLLARRAQRIVARIPDAARAPPLLRRGARRRRSRAWCAPAATPRPARRSRRRCSTEGAVARRRRAACCSSVPARAIRGC